MLRALILDGNGKRWKINVKVLLTEPIRARMVNHIFTLKSFNDLTIKLRFG